MAKYQGKRIFTNGGLDAWRAVNFSGCEEFFIYQSENEDGYFFYETPGPRFNVRLEAVCVWRVKPKQ